MAKLYVKSPSGNEIHSLDVVVDAYSVGGQAETGYNEHYIISHTGYLLFKRCYIYHEGIQDTPFEMWQPGCIATPTYQNSTVDIPTKDLLYYIRRTKVSSSNTGANRFILYSPTNTATSFDLFIFGEIVR